MEFQLKILLVSFFATIILGIFMIPILQRLKVGQSEREDGPKSHFKKQGTPTMGGIIMMISTIIGVTLAYIYFTVNGAHDIAQNLIPLLCLSIGVGIVGFIDDFKKLVLKNTKGLKPSSKMLGLLIISIAYTLFIMKFSNIGTDTYIPFLSIAQLPL